MYDFLAKKLGSLFKSLKGQKSLNEANIKVALDEVKASFLEADVDYKVVNKLIDEIKEKAIGCETLSGIDPDQQFVKIVNDRLVDILGEKKRDIVAHSGTSVLMLVGMQGSGKTTVAAKLARHLKEKGKKVLLVACDLQRPAAIKQLEILAERVPCDIFSSHDEKAPRKVASDAIKFAKGKGFDYIIFDTAGRLDIDEVLMEEIQELRAFIKPHEIFMVLDAMMGQSALKMAEKFHESVAFDSVIVNKMDSDARGGLILSVKEALDTPVKFLGVGEKITDLDVFYPDRVASRILGMGDVVSLVEKAEKTFYEGEAEAIEKRIREKGLSIEDFYLQLKKIKKMGSLKNLMGLIPGMSSIPKEALDDKQFIKIESFICSMTKEERQYAHLLNTESRLRRIARGAGRTIGELKQFIGQFKRMSQAMKMVAKGDYSSLPPHIRKNIPPKLMKSMGEGGGGENYRKKRKKEKRFLGF